MSFPCLTNFFFSPFLATVSMWACLLSDIRTFFTYCFGTCRGSSCSQRPFSHRRERCYWTIWNGMYAKLSTDTSSRSLAPGNPSAQITRHEFYFFCLKSPDSGVWWDGGSGDSCAHGIKCVFWHVFRFEKILFVGFRFFHLKRQRTVTCVLLGNERREVVAFCGSLPIIQCTQTCNILHFAYLF